MPDFSLNINPAQSEFIVKPGTAVIQAYDITNNSGNTLYLTTSVEPWQPVGSDGSVTYHHPNTNELISFSLNNADLKMGETFALQPGQKRQLVLKVKPDPAAIQKDYYYTFFINQSQTNQINPDSARTSTQAKVGTHLLFSVSDTNRLSVSARILEFVSFPKIKDCFLSPINFSALIENQTPNFFKTEGKITVYKNDREMAKLDLSPQNVLGNHTRSILCTPAQTCTLHPPFWPGAYTANLSLSATDSSQPVTTTFYIFPFSILALIFPLALLTIFFTRKTHSKPKN